METLAHKIAKNNKIQLHDEAWNLTKVYNIIYPINPQRVKYLDLESEMAISWVKRTPCCVIHLFNKSVQNSQI